MKKILAIIAVLAILVVPCTLSANAEGAINTYEQNILDVLDQNVQLGKTTYHLPDNYINQAKNYFLTIDISEAQSEQIIEHINEGIATLKAATLPTKEFDMAVLPTETKQTVLKAGQDACAVINLNLIYNSNTGKVVITATPDGSGSPVEVFNADPIVKVTGSNVNLSIIAAVFGSLAIVAVAAVVVSKKAKMF